MERKPERNPAFFERWAAKNCMKPICIVRDPDGDILIADSIEPIRVLGGVYRTGFAINRDGLEFGSTHDYPSTEFILYSKAGGVQKRVNEALAHARATQEELKSSGFYDGDGKHRFSKRPD